MSIRYIQTNYNKLGCYNIIKFLLDLSVVNLDIVKPYEQERTYVKGDFVYLKENNIHKIYRCKVDVSFGELIPGEWEHIMDKYDEEVKIGTNLLFREYDFIVDNNNFDTIINDLIIPDYKLGKSNVTIFIGKDIFVHGIDFSVDENGKIIFNYPIEIEVGHKIIVEVKDIIGQIERLVILSTDGNNYEIGAIDDNMIVLKTDDRYSVPELFIRDEITDISYKLFMISDRLYFEQTDIYVKKTELNILDNKSKQYNLKIINGDLVFSPKE